MESKLTALEKFNLIIESKKERYLFMHDNNAVFPDDWTIEQKTNVIMYRTMRDMMVQSLGIERGKKVDEAEERNSVGEGLRKALGDGEISDQEFKEICNLDEYRNYFGIPEKPKLILGRHQQFLAVMGLLDRRVTTEDFQLAYTKDIKEYDELFEEFERLRVFRDSSGGLIDNKVVGEIHDRVLQSLKKGYQDCVLQNNPALEAAYLEIDDDCNGFILELAKKEGSEKEQEMFDSIKKINGLHWIQSYLGYMQAGPSLFYKEQDEQSAWFIYQSIHPVNKDAMTIITYLILSHCITDGRRYAYENLPVKEKEMLDNILSFARLLLERGKISHEQLKMVEQSFSSGKEMVNAHLKNNP